jgi:hypothetical protein
VRRPHRPHGLILEQQHDYAGSPHIGQHDGVSDKKSPVEQAIDLFFFAPLGLLLNVDEVLPQLVERGRQQVTMARMFGQFAVQQGQTEATKAVAKVQEQAAELAGRRAPKPRPAPAAAPAAAANNAATTPRAPARPAPATGPAAATLAIPDYESLSASQVVPRLEGLSHAELDAVRGYEAAHRGRKTILNKIAQLQG